MSSRNLSGLSDGARGRATPKLSPVALMCLLVAAVLADAAQAWPVTLDGTFTSRIVVPTERQSLVNGIALTSAGGVVANHGAFDFHRGNPPNFSNAISRLDFVHGAPFVYRLANAFEFIPAPAAGVAAGQEVSPGTLRTTPASSASSA